MAKINVRDDGRIVEIELADPPLNILDIAMLEELREALRALPPQRAAIVITGSGTRAFSAGASVQDHTPGRVAAMLAVFHDCFRLLNRIDAPTVAVVNGLALGGGCELAMGCDFVLAGDRAEFGQPEIRLGVFAPVASIQLSRIAGPRRALELLLSGESIPAAKAEAWGLVNEVFPHETLREQSRGWMERFLRHSASSIAFGKQAWRLGSAEEFEARLEAVERLYLEGLMKTDDAREGIDAFVEKRQPRWKT